MNETPETPENRPGATEAQGDGGGVSIFPTPCDGHDRARPREVRETLNMVNRALRNGWGVSPEARKAVLQGCLQVFAAQDKERAASGDQGPKRYLYGTKQRLTAAKLLMEMSRQDVALEMAGDGAGSNPSMVEVAREAERRRCLVLTADSVQRMAEEAARAQLAELERSEANGQILEAEATVVESVADGHTRAGAVGGCPGTPGSPS